MLLLYPQTLANTALTTFKSAKASMYTWCKSKGLRGFLIPLVVLAVILAMLGKLPATARVSARCLFTRLRKCSNSVLMYLLEQGSLLRDMKLKADLYTYC